MLPYLLLLLLTVSIALIYMRPLAVLQPSRLGLVWSVYFILLLLMIGFRHEVGGDWDAYLNYVDDVRDEPLNAVFGFGDPAYQLLNWLAANIGGGIYFVNIVCAAVFCFGLSAFCRIQPRPWLALMVAVPYLVMVVAMGYSRQAVAIGLAMFAITKLQNGKIIHFALWILLATTFHKSAIILMPFAIFAESRHRLLTLLGIFLSAALFFFIFLLEQLQYYTDVYVVAEYESSGASLRIAMNAIPSIIYLFFKNRFNISPKICQFWTWMAWGALILVIVLMISPSSTIVDRVALYWIPLQVLVFSRLPDAFGLRGRRNPSWVLLIVAYSSSVMLVWLFFSDMAYAWLPYQFYPWLVLWS